MLSTRLQALTKPGSSAALSTRGPRSVAYELTGAGRALLSALDQISPWADAPLPPAASRACSDESRV
jgi:DNA-binding HxlR family transcriptional regulator